MVGILSYGAYLPMWRVDRGKIANESGGGSMGGERTVASIDEDSLTMAVEAGLDCLSGIDPKEIDGLYFATISSPFRQKQASSIIAAALDFREDIQTYDLTSTTRAATSAVKAAFDTVKAGSGKKILVIAADCRRARPRSEFEQIYGDGAAALLIGEGKIIARIEGFSSVSNAIPGGWQTTKDKYLKTYEPKIDRMYGILKDVPGAVNRLMRENYTNASDVSTFALYGPDPRSHRDLARALKIDPKTQLQDSLFSTVGITGTPHCLILFVSALEKAEPNEKIICASYGEGSDAFMVITNEKAGSMKEKPRGMKYIYSKRMIASYGQFLDFQGTREIGWPPKGLKASVVKYWRDQKWELPLYGMRCKDCGTLQYPISRCCMICGQKDNHDEVKITRKGSVYSYAHDYLMGPGLLPGDGINPTTRAIVDMEDGCRLWLEMTDHEVQEVEVDMAVETTFRLIHQKGGYRYYGWRARPFRG